MIIRKENEAPSLCAAFIEIRLLSRILSFIWIFMLIVYTLFGNIVLHTQTHKKKKFYATQKKIRTHLFLINKHIDSILLHISSVNLRKKYSFFQKQSQHYCSKRWKQFTNAKNNRKNSAPIIHCSVFDNRFGFFLFKFQHCHKHYQWLNLLNFFLLKHHFFQLYSEKGVTMIFQSYQIQSVSIVIMFIFDWWFEKKIHSSFEHSQNKSSKYDELMSNLFFEVNFSVLFQSSKSSLTISLHELSLNNRIIAPIKHWKLKLK